MTLKIGPSKNSIGVLFKLLTNALPNLKTINLAKAKVGERVTTTRAVIVRIRSRKNLLVVKMSKENQKVRKNYQSLEAYVSYAMTLTEYVTVPRRSRLMLLQSNLRATPHHL